MTVVDVNGTPIVRGVLYSMVFDGRPSNIGVLVRYQDGKMVSVEGILPKKVVAVGEYPVIPVEDLPRLLSERVSGRVRVYDWVLDNIAFTRLTITKVELVYRLVAGGYVVPVYVFEGTYELDYNGIYERGVARGMIVAVERQS